MTKREAVRLCKKVWRPVAIGIVPNKDAAIKLLTYAQRKKIEACSCSCPLCEYDSNIQFHNDDACKNCPLITQNILRWVDDRCPCLDRSVSFAAHPQKFAKLVMRLKD